LIPPDFGCTNLLPAGLNVLAFRIGLDTTGKIGLKNGRGTIRNPSLIPHLLV
jgi:hypothetical protein